MAAAADIEARTALSDPERRPDGLCACGCGRPLPGPPATRRPDVAVALATDPFASVACCRRWFGLPVEADDEGGPRAARDGRRSALLQAEAGRWAADD